MMDVSKYEQSKLTVENKISFVAGKVQVRSAGSPDVPAKNQPVHHDSENSICRSDQLLH